MKSIDQIGGDVVDAAVKLHKELGPGLLESVYETCLAASLIRSGYKVDRQKPVDFKFDGMHFSGAFRLDLLVEDKLIVEIKSVERITGAHAKQLLTYLRLGGKEVGLLLNFSGETIKEGIRRIVNGYSPG